MERATIDSMHERRQTAIRMLLWGWFLLVMQIGHEGQHFDPVLVLTPLVRSLFGADNAREFFSHTPNFSISFLLVLAGGATLTWPKLWWVWGGALPAIWLFSFLHGSAPAVATSVTLSMSILPLILAIGELGKRRWPQVGVPTIWAVVSLIIYNAIVEFMPGAYPNTLDSIDFVYGALGAITAYVTLFIWAKTE